MGKISLTAFEIIFTHLYKLQLSRSLSLNVYHTNLTVSLIHFHSNAESIEAGVCICSPEAALSLTVSKGKCIEGTEPLRQGSCVVRRILSLE